MPLGSRGVLARVSDGARQLFILVVVVVPDYFSGGRVRVQLNVSGNYPLITSLV